MRDNCSGERPSFVTHLECAATGERHEADRPHGHRDNPSGQPPHVTLASARGLV